VIVFSDEELMRYVREDVPYGDLTTHLQDACNVKARLNIYTREPIVVACIEEASRIGELLGVQVRFAIRRGGFANANQTLLEFEGSYEALHHVWRSAQNLLEFSCKIATVTHDMVTKIGEFNPKCELLTTRKSFPFAKQFCIKSVMAGGGFPHRLGLSETILLFPQHRILYDTQDAFLSAVKRMQERAPEKHVAVETESLEEAKILLQNGVDLLQVDKASPKVLEQIVTCKDDLNPKAKILAAGGIGPKNVQEFAKTGVDGIVTSAVYAVGMANLGSVMERL
jgi:molybdenum transport protein